MKEEKMQSCRSWHGGSASDAVYGLGLIGALVFFWQHAPTFTDKLIAVIKALIWPALVVYKLLGFLQIS